VERLCKLGVLERQPASEWALPSFILPTKDRTVCFLSDFLEVNKRLVRKPFSIPKISTVLQELEGFTFATALDHNMGYYTIRLDLDASKICTIIFLLGTYSYKRLPMGIAGCDNVWLLGLINCEYLAADCKAFSLARKGRQRSGN
jgi:hypothetical protein